MNLEEYYGKFNEEKRLNSRFGQVEFITSIKYIHEALNLYENPKIMDIGAGTGRYSCYLADEGYDVTAVELIKSNLGTLKAKNKNVKAYQGNALDLSKFKDETYDVTILFGPMYHLKSYEEKIKALLEAKRITKKGGRIFVAYILNDYALLSYGFMDGNILKAINTKALSKDFQILDNGNELYSYVRIEDIKKLSNDVNLNRYKIVSADSSANYIREQLKKLSEEEFKIYVDYHLSICEREDMLGASAHIVDILIKE